MNCVNHIISFDCLRTVVKGFKRKVFVALFAMVTLVSGAQSSSKAGEVDIFMGLDFNCRDIYFNNRVFDVLVNLTPGVRWNMGHRWEASLQLYVPVINQYGDYYKRIRPRVVTLSKQLALTSKWKMKVTGGIFTADSYGLDVKTMYVFNPWLAASAQFGLTGYLSMAYGWKASPTEKFTFMVGPEFYLSRWNTQMWLRGGRWLYGDYGGEAEIMRHFRHCSVGVYGSYSMKWKENAGFKVIIMLPPYKRVRRRVNFRPADDFRFNYAVQATYYGMRRYFTDAEENERTGWFDRDLVPWGTDLMEPDFKEIEKKAKDEKPEVVDTDEGK